MAGRTKFPLRFLFIGLAIAASAFAILPAIEARHRSAIRELRAQLLERLSENVAMGGSESGPVGIEDRLRHLEEQNQLMRKYNQNDYSKTELMTRRLTSLE